MHILAVDTGSKHLGIAISNSTAVIANPLLVLNHIRRLVDATAVAKLVTKYEVGLIVVGQSVDEEGNPTVEGRRSARFAEVLKTLTSTPIVLWDEAFTTQDARAAYIEMGIPRKKRRGHHDDMAATILLQSYLDARNQGLIPSSKS